MSTIEELNIAERRVSTDAAQEDSLATGQRDAEAVRAAWETIVDKYLIEWGKNPSVIEEYDLAPPTGPILLRSIELARACAADGWPAPQRVLPDGDGGVIFERGTGAVFQSLRVDRDGRIELLTFHNSKLVARDQFSLV